MPRGGRQPIPRPSDVTPGAPAAWVGRSTLPERIDRDLLVELGAQQASTAGTAVQRHSAAILIPFTAESGSVELIFVKRSSRARTHAGEIAFPGGMADPGDVVLETTALREAHEEVGLEPGRVEPVAVLEPTPTFVSSTVVTPIVGWVVEPGELAREPDEVDAIIRVPIVELVSPLVYRCERWHFGAIARDISFFEIEGETIWGLTAGILRRMFDEIFDLVESGPRRR